MKFLKKSSFLSLAFLSIFSLGATLELSTAYADPPPWAPAHGYRAKHYKYYYYPKYQVYYSPIQHRYYWLDGTTWTYGVRLPPTIVINTKPVTVQLDTLVPYERHHDVILMYPY